MAKIINGTYSYEIDDNYSVCLSETTRELMSTSKTEFEHGKPKRKTCGQSFCRTGSSINWLPSDLDFEHFDGLKVTVLLLEILH